MAQLPEKHTSLSGTVTTLPNSRRSEQLKCHGKMLGFQSAFKRVPVSYEQAPELSAGESHRKDPP